jgi:hypothetical protein
MEIDNRLRGKIAMLGPIPFYCHDNETWRAGDREGMKTRRDFRAAGYRICGGWTAAVRELAATGYYNEAQLATKAYATMAYEDLKAFLASDDPEEKAEVLEEMRGLLKRLGDKYRKFAGKSIDI